MFFVHTIAIGLLGIGIGMLYFGKVEGFLWILAAPSSYLLAGIAYLLSRQRVSPHSNMRAVDLPALTWVARIELLPINRILTIQSRTVSIRGNRWTRECCSCVHQPTVLEAQPPPNFLTKRSQDYVDGRGDRLDTLACIARRL